MVKARKAPELGLGVGDPEYWELLERSLHNAKDLLWKRLQHGLYADDEEAKATMDAYWAIRKVVRLMEEKIRQLPLPGKKAEVPPPSEVAEKVAALGYPPPEED